MWHCSKCGETIPDNLDVCWRCGAHRDGAPLQEFRAGPDDPTVPDPKSESPESDQATGGEVAPSGRPKRALTQESLAALLLRLLGLYFATFGVVGAIAEAGLLLVLLRRVGLNAALEQNYRYFIRPGAELLIGAYFLIGGQWVYDKILTPLCRTSLEDVRTDTEEDGPDDRQGKDNTRIANHDRPQRPPSADKADG